MKKSRRLILSRETIQRLDEPILRKLAGGGVVAIPNSQQQGCISPLCMPTYWVGCETQVNAQVD